MDTDLLLSWLRLPAGAWPAEDRALLGLPEGSVDAATAEQHALARMEWLRPHQLRHPELVSEGMNKLAQALITFLTPASPEQPYQPSLEPHGPIEKAYQPGIAPPWQPVDIEPEPEPEPVPVEAEVVMAEVVEDAIVDAEVVEKGVRTLLLPPAKRARVKPAVQELPGEPLPPGLVVVPQDRRRAYQDLVLLRRLLRAWEALSPIVGNPSEPLETAESVYLWLTACWQTKVLLGERKRAKSWFRRTGQLVRSVVRSSHPVLLLRDMLPDQRNRLAADWANARTQLQAEYAAQRESLRTSKPRSSARSVWRNCANHLRRNPEWILGLLTLACVLVGVARWARK